MSNFSMQNLERAVNEKSLEEFKYRFRKPMPKDGAPKNMVLSIESEMNEYRQVLIDLINSSTTTGTNRYLIEYHKYEGCHNSYSFVCPKYNMVAIEQKVVLKTGDSVNDRKVINCCLHKVRLGMEEHIKYLCSYLSMFRGVSAKVSPSVISGVGIHVGDLGPSHNRAHPKTHDWFLVSVHVPVLTQ